MHPYPCWCCGGQPRVSFDGWDGCVVLCLECSDGEGNAEVHAPTELAAIDAWNDRALDNAAWCEESPEIRERELAAYNARVRLAGLAKGAPLSGADLAMSAAQTGLKAVIEMLDELKGTGS